MASIQQLLQDAVAHQQAGRLSDAEALYREVITRDDRQPDAWHLLGTIAQQIGDSATAAELIGRAIELAPQNASFHCNLGNALLGLGRMDEAEACYRAAIERKPDFPLAHFNLGGLLARAGRTTDAIASYEHAIQLKPDFAEAHYNLALIYQQQHSWTAATAAYQRTLLLRSDHADAWNNLGLVLREQGSPGEAIQCHLRAIQVRPEYAEAFNNLGVAYRELREVQRALECYTRALQLKPDYAICFNNLGNLLLSMGRPADAVTCLKRAVELQPGIAAAFTNLGAALQDLRRLNEAEECLRAALQLNPDDAATLQSLGNVVRDGGDTAEAINCYRRALELNPNGESALGQLIHQLQHQCAWDELPQLTDRALQAVMSKPCSPTDSPLAPFAFLTMPIATSSQQQQQCAARWAAYASRTAIPIQPWWTATAPTGTSPSVSELPREDSRIRIGYLSADFRAHPVAELIVELFEVHDRSRFEVIAYSYGPDDGSAMRSRMMAAFDTFVDLREMPLAESIQRISADRIDILVDLTGFTQHARTELLASRAAPVQVNYLGYPGTLGANFVDYILVDEFIVPPDRQAYYNESLVHLSGCYQVNDTRREVSASVPTRGESGLPEEGFVFCSFNSNYKITAEMFAVWMELLRQTPSSVLWLLESNRQSPGNLRREAERRGVDPQRLVFAPRRPLPDHLARHQLADLFLDTFPVNAHTTASDALWAGLPVLTLSGETFVSRVAGSLLTTLGLPELITFHQRDYRDRAIHLSRNPQELAELRLRLAANRRTSPVFDIARSARAIEQAYTTMHAIRCSGARPHPFCIGEEVQGPAQE